MAVRGACGLLFLCAAIFWNAPALARQYTVCSLTITTDDEVEEFRRHLGDEDFEFVELTPPDRRAFRMSPWFPDACRSGVRCDVVVISAEFAGSYFQDGGLNLPLQELEELSCSRECSGILHRPLEVFLFACNSLASKGPDQRTPEEYLQVLLDHGFDRAQAERVVAARYGALGSSFCETTRRVFAGVPLIYGFDSRAPSGRNVRPLVRAYLRRMGSYADHLKKLEEAQADSQKRPYNPQIERVFRNTEFRQTTGVRPGEPAFRKREVVCALYDERRSVAERMDLVWEIMEGPDFLAYLPNIQTFLDRHPPAELEGSARETFASLTTIGQAKDQLMELIGGQSLPLLELELARFAHQMSWIDFETFHAMARSGVSDLLDGPRLGFQAREIICEISKMADLSSAFTIDDLPSGSFSDPNGIMAVDCLGIQSREVMDGLTRGLGSPDALTRAWAIYAISHRSLSDATHVEALARLLHDPEPEVRWLADQTLRYLRPRGAKSIDAIRRVAPDFEIDWIPRPQTSSGG